MSKKKRSKEAEVGTEKREDKSPFIYQGDKVKIELQIREFPWTEKQKQFIDIALDSKTNYLFCQAPAGTGKTLLSIFVGLKLLQEGKIRNIYFARNPVESSSFGLGYLAGDLQSKMSPYSMPMMDHLNELLPPSQIKFLIDSGVIQSVPIGFLKGRTFNLSLIIGEEAEDLQVVDFRLLMGRLGRRSKMLIIGDIDQSNVRNGGFQKICDLFNSQECVDNGIHYFSFTTADIMRNKILGYVIDKFKFLK